MKFKIENMPRINLRLFDGAAGGDGAGAAAPGQGNAGAPGDTKAAASDAGKRKSGEFDNVIFGKQEPTAAAGGAAEEGQKTDPSDAGKGKASTQSAEDRRKAFMAMVTGDGEFKDLFDEQIQRIIDRRFKETKGLQEQLGRNQPIIDMMMQRYGITDGDPAKLMAAVENDDAYWAKAAEEAGMSEEQYKEVQRLKRENAAYRNAERQWRKQQAAGLQYQQWFTEGEQVKGVYPEFDLEAEAKNPRFVAMLRAGVTVQHAYEVMHIDAIKAGAAKQAAEQTEKQVVDGIRARGARPQENGGAAQSGFTVKSDVTKLTKKEREEIARRARMNPDQKITF